MASSGVGVVRRFDAAGTVPIVVVSQPGYERIAIRDLSNSSRRQHCNSGDVCRWNVATFRGLAQRSPRKTLTRLS